MNYEEKTDQLLEQFNLNCSKLQNNIQSLNEFVLTKKETGLDMDIWVGNNPHPYARIKVVITNTKSPMPEYYLADDGENKKITLDKHTSNVEGRKKFERKSDLSKYEEFMIKNEEALKQETITKNEMMKTLQKV